MPLPSTITGASEAVLVELRERVEDEAAVEALDVAREDSLGSDSLGMAVRSPAFALRCSARCANLRTYPCVRPSHQTRTRTTDGRSGASRSSPSPTRTPPGRSHVGRARLDRAGQHRRAGRDRGRPRRVRRVLRDRPDYAPGYARQHESRRSGCSLRRSRPRPAAGRTSSARAWTPSRRDTARRSRRSTWPAGICFGRATGMRVSDLLGGTHQEEFPLYTGVGIDDPDTMRGGASMRSPPAIDRIQIKVGNGPARGRRANPALRRGARAGWRR